MKLTRDDPRFDLYVKFHSGQYTDGQRTVAKSLLYHLHYGNVDTTEADAEVKRLKEQSQ